MAYSTGTATGLADLHAIIRTFALANGWVDVYYSAGEGWIGKGEGDNGNDEVYVEISTYFAPSISTWTFDLGGAMGYRPGTTTLEDFVNPCHRRYLALWDSTMQYWLTVNGRRISFVIKVGTKYASCYLGLVRPLGTQEQIPYPMFIGGSYNTRLSHTVSTNQAFWGDRSQSMLGPGGQPYGYGQNYPYTIATSQSYVFPWADGTEASGQGQNLQCGPTLDGSYLIQPSFPMYRAWSNFQPDAQIRHYLQLLGQLDGMYHVSGYGQSAENVIQVGADNYMCFPAYDSTELDEWIAFELN